MGGDGTREEKELVRGVYEKEAPKYDRGMRFFERFILGDARRWACSRAEGDVLELAVEFDDESSDTVVCTYALCTIPDDRKAVAEAGRVLRPEGRLLLLEHVRSPLLPIRVGQRLLEPLTLRFEADHLLRDPAGYLPEQGFEIETLERSKWGIVERVVVRKSGT